MRTYWFIFVLLVGSGLFAQQTSVTGKVVTERDSVVAFARVTLISTQDSSKTLSVQCDESGTFLFQDVAPGSYKAEITSLETNDYLSEEFTVADLPLQMSFRVKEGTTMKEVVVKGKRDEVRMEEGKMIINVENSVSNSGQSAVEVLRKSPGIAVDQDGNIQLRGKNGVQVMIDDKVMYLSGDQLASLLRSIPAEQIKEIEIITSPSAKYDASGNAGIINIRLKKGAYEGLTGRTNASFGYGRYYKSSFGLNLTYKKKKNTIHINYQGGYRKGFNDFGSTRVNGNEEVVNNYFKTATIYTVPNWNHNLQLTGDYRITDKTTLNYDFNNTISGHRWDGLTNAEQRNQEGGLVNTFEGHDTGKQLNINSYSGIGFQHKPDTLGSLWSGQIAFNGNIGWKDKIQDINTFEANGSQVSTPFLFNQENDNNSRFYLAQLDYLRKRKAVKWESGAKFTRLEFENPFHTTIEQNGTVTISDSRYYYQEQVLGSYSMLSGKYRNWSLQGGVRMENTWMYASYSVADTSFSRHYTNIFPSGNISYKQSDKTSYSLSFSRRITRPTSEQLNPIINYLDPYSGFGGDAFLRPQLTNTGELTYSIYNGTFVAAVNYSYITMPIVWMAREDKETGIFIGGMRNMEAQNSYGASFSLNQPFTKWWTANYNVNLFNNSFIGDAGYGQIQNQRMGWSFKTSQRINLPKEYSIELSGTYDSPSNYAFAYNIERTQINAAIQKRMMAKKAVLKFAVNDAFYGFQYGGRAQMGPINLVNFYRWDNRTFILSFNYKFGNQLMKE